MSEQNAESRPTTIPSLVGYGPLVLIGRGGSASVYRSYDVRSEQPVAIKVLDVAELPPAALRRFERECKAAGALSSNPNVVPVLAGGATADGKPYLVMELVEGESLAERLRRQKRLPASAVVSLGRELLSGLGAAHELGIVHGEITPGTVMFSNDGRPQLADFAIGAIPGTHRTGPGNVTAATAFAAPEVINGRRADKSSDLYSLAATLAALAVGRSVFARGSKETLTAYVYRILRDPPRSLEPYGVSRELSDVLHTGMAKTPSGRYPTAAAFLDALAEVPEAAPEDASDVMPVVVPEAGLIVASESVPDAEPAVVPDAEPAVVPDAEPAVVPDAEPAVEAVHEEPAVAYALLDAVDAPRVVAVAAPPPGAVRQPQRRHRRQPRRRRGAVLIGAAAALVLVAVVAALALWPGNSRQGVAAEPSAPRSPVADLSSTPAATLAAPSFTSTCTGRSCVFAFGTTNAVGGETLLWQFGDGTTRSGPARVTHHYRTAGNYTASLIASRGARSAASKSVSIGITRWARSLRVRAGRPGSSRLSVIVIGPARCRPATFILERRAAKWRNVGNGRLRSRVTTVRVPGPARYRLNLAETDRPGGFCPAALSGAVTIRATARHVSAPPTSSSTSEPPPTTPTTTTPTTTAPTTTAPTRTTPPSPTTPTKPPPVKYTPPPLK